MAIYYLSNGFVTRSTGRTCVQSAAYICGEKLHEDYRDKDVSYKNRSHDVAFHKTIAPEHSKYKDLSVWNAIENFENRYAENFFKKEEAKNKYLSSARTARTIVLALPKELSNECNIELVEKFAKEVFLSRNLIIITYAIHNKEGNPHAHLQISLRAVGEDGEFVNRKDRGICEKAFLLSTRTLWADLANEHLAREGFDEKITEKNFSDIGVGLESTIHRGWYASKLGTDSRIVQENIKIRKENEERILANPSIILDLLNEKKAVFTQKDILKTIGDKVFDEKNISVIFEKVLESSLSVGTNINGEFIYTGEKYQQMESDVLSKFESLFEQRAKTQCNEDVVSSIIDKYSHLSDEQKTAVIGLTSDINFGILLGKAGAGKTTAMQAISEVYKQNGSRVIGMSLSAVASENLGKDADIQSATIASWAYRWSIYESSKKKFLSFNSVLRDGILKQIDWYNTIQRYEQYQLKAGDVIIVDEAGMIGAKEWERILDAADRFNAKIIAVGDDNQFKPISAGDCFRNFVSREPLQAKSGSVPENNFTGTISSDVEKPKQHIFELSEIRRQKSDWMREASVELSKMNVGAALEKYERHGKIHAAERKEIYQQIAEKYLENEKLGTTAVLCSTNRDCAAVNDAVRDIKKSNGELSDDLVKINDRNFAENDKVIFLENNKKFDVKNGQCGIIKSFNRGILSIHTEDGIKNINVQSYSKLGHAYAITLHKSQGKTYDNTIVLAHKMMDAKSMYVGMTRHRENVHIYYSQSDFGSFQSLVNSVSKYNYKESLVDYEHPERINKSKSSPCARVIKYYNLRLEIVSVLRDIRNEEASWKEYNELKVAKVNLEKEILGDYKAHKLYLDQLEITKEKLEISAGLRARPMTRAEEDAKNTVAFYVESSQEARAMFWEMKEAHFNVTKHRDYEKYCGIIERRNALAEKILTNQPLHREFVNETSREYFISFKNMEKQIAYGNSLKQGKLRDGIIGGIFAKFEATKSDAVRKIAYEGSSVADRMVLDTNSSRYEERFEKQLSTLGYAPHVSKSMMFAYCGEKSLSNIIHSGSFSNEYASMLVQQKIGELGLQKPTLEIAEDAIKQALCFKALQETFGIQKLDHASISELHKQSSVLSEKLITENIHVLKNTGLMTETSDALKGIEKSVDKNNFQLLSTQNIKRLIDINQMDISSEVHNPKSIELEKTHIKEEARNFEISV